jgi:hypothetical protein
MGTWYESGRMMSSGDCGGDIQASDSFTRRFVKSVRTAEGWAVVDVTYFAAHDDPCCTGYREGFWVCRMTEYTVCTDPAQPHDTPVWEDSYTCDDDRDAHVFVGCWAAENRARHLALTFDPRTLTWDGRIFSGRADTPEPK